MRQGRWCPLKSYFVAVEQNHLARYVHNSTMMLGVAGKYGTCFWHRWNTYLKELWLNWSKVVWLLAQKPSTSRSLDGVVHRLQRLHPTSLLLGKVLKPKFKNYPTTNRFGYRLDMKYMRRNILRTSNIGFIFVHLVKLRAPTHCIDTCIVFFIMVPLNEMHLC